MAASQCERTPNEESETNGQGGVRCAEDGGRVWGRWQRGGWGGGGHEKEEPTITSKVAKVGSTI